MGKHMIKALIFDMDGVIIDSEPIHFESDRITMREYGIEISDDVLIRYVGVTNPAMWAELKELYNLDSSIDELLEKQLKHKFDLFGTRKLKAIDGICELVNLLKEKGIKIGLASSSPRVFIELILKNLEIIDFFDVIVSGDDVLKSKPEPDIFLRASKLLGVEPKDCMVIEDSEHGVKAAKSAGMKCIGYINVNSGNMDLSYADLQVASIRDIDINLL